MPEISAFKNYTPGDPTCRLYIKNLAKTVEEKVVFTCVHMLKCVQLNPVKHPLPGGVGGVNHSALQVKSSVMKKRELKKNC